MSSFAVLLLCIQACLVQNVFSQCHGSFAPVVSTTPYGYGAGIAEMAYPAGLGVAGAYPGNFGYTGANSGAFAGISNAAAYGGAFAPGAAYGGAGEGNVAVFGELPVAGNTAVAGQVPVMGAVNFGGAVPAAGAVSISGNCACGCNSPYMY